MDRKEANKWLHEAEVLDLCSGYNKDRQAVDVAVDSMETLDSIERFIKVEFINYQHSKNIVEKGMYAAYQNIYSIIQKTRNV